MEAAEGPDTKPRLPPSTIDWRKGVPEWVRRAIETHLAIEAEDARSAGTVGYMTRALVLATMPYKDPKVDAFTRRNGDFALRIVAGYAGGIPFGIYPRLLMSWVTTEAVRTNSPVIELGDSLSVFLRDVIGVRNTGGVHGTATRVSEQMKRLFGSLITAHYEGSQSQRGFALRNVLIAEDLTVDEQDFERRMSGALAAPSELQAGGDSATGANDVATPALSSLWLPQAAHEAGVWRSRVRLSSAFFAECVGKPVPIDLRAYRALRDSPLAMDVYTWLTYRMSYTERRTRPIRWESLMMQFGSGFNLADMGQATRDFKKAFLRALKMVQIVYPQARIEVLDDGLVLMPSRPHVQLAPKPTAKPLIKQDKLF